MTVKFLEGEKPYRVRKIEVKRSNAIDSVKISYDDETFWSVGHDGGKADPRVAVMAEGESIVEVTHEAFYQKHAVGSGFEFVTNFGRRFIFETRDLTTKLAQERVTVKAEEGHEIVGLRINRGMLLGTTQQEMSEGSK